ncbi:unnamed protein product [Arctia plantaginis]|uniref:Uncharacterized protein n=1 Tax=Arctia plantaginis TaxID=874455 RepID=A0A8S1A8K7_ARCPL|nr:unnamed protein product [Arctia plantaginis]CAB3241614.1 unnamed protein product [Arctia plantaginis]
MAAKIVGFLCVQLALFNVIQAQCLNRFPGLLPGCGVGPGLLPVEETIIPNQVLLNPNYRTQVVDVPYGLETVVSNPVTLPGTTIIQDSTVANNLANALQLLVVSNLLSNTLPTANEIYVPSYGPMDYGMVSPIISSCGYSPYNYIY